VSERTPELDEFLSRYEADHNEWWRIECGHHMNLFDMAVERMKAAEDATARFGIPLYAMLDLWMALGGDPTEFDRWSEEPEMYPVEMWSFLLAAVRGDDLTVNHNPPPGRLLDVVNARAGSVDPEGEWPPGHSFIPGAAPAGLPARPSVCPTCGSDDPRHRNIIRNEGRSRLRWHSMTCPSD